MRRRTFLGLLGLTGCKCELEDMRNIPKKQWWLNTSAESGPFDGPEYTNSEGQQAFLLIGDSIGRGNSDASGSTPTAGTVYQWDAGSSSIVEVGADDLLEVQAIKTPNGSPWPRFGINYNAATGKKPVFVCTAIGGASFYSSNTSFSWWTNASLYSNAKTKCDNALSALGVTKVRAVFIICGYNDVQNTYTYAYSYLTSLIDRINTDYDTPNIYMSLPNQNNVSDTTFYTNLMTIKKMIRQLSFDYSNVELFCSLETINRQGSHYQVDNVHLNFAGNEALGAALAKQITLSSSYHKQSRFIIGSFYSSLSDARKTLIDNFITSQVTSGNWQLFDNFYFFKVPDVNDTPIDWFGLSNPVTSQPTFSANGYLQTNGSSTRIIGPTLSITQNKSLIASDVILGCRLATNVDGSGLDGCLFGVREDAAGTIITEYSQTTTPDLAFRLSDTTARVFSTGDDYFVNDTLHSIARNGSERYIIKNKTIVDTSTQASSTFGPAFRSLAIGARNLSGTIDRYFSGQYVYFFRAKYSTFDLDSFYDEMETLIAGW